MDGALSWRAQYEAWARTDAHRARVARAREVIHEAARMGRLVVSSSWGKDSAALVHLAWAELGPIEILHFPSPAALPGFEEMEATYEGLGCTIHRTPAKTLAEYTEFVHQAKLPHYRSKAEQSRIVATLKRSKGAAWCIDNGFAVQALGMRIAEGGPRAKVLKSRGPVYTNKDGIVRANPLAYWDGIDVWAYIVTHDVPYNRRVYDAETHGFTRETIRNTGLFSTDGAREGWIAWLRQHFPAQYRILVREFPEVRALT